MARQTKFRTSLKIDALAKTANTPSKRLADLNVAKFGTNRTSELKGKIGNNGKSFHEIYNGKIESL